MSLYRKDQEEAEETGKKESEKGSGDKRSYGEFTAQWRGCLREGPRESGRTPKVVEESRSFKVHWSRTR